MSLQAKLDAFKADFEAGEPPYRVPRAVIDTMHRATKELIASGLAQRALKAGDVAPRFTLSDPEGIERLSRSAPGGDALARRRAAIRACSAMVGSLILARMSDDEELAQELVNESLSWVAERREPAEATARAD